MCPLPQQMRRTICNTGFNITRNAYRVGGCNLSVNRAHDPMPEYNMNNVQTIDQIQTNLQIRLPMHMATYFELPCKVNNTVPVLCQIVP